jgi:RND family efflux transporter MFP subunit
LNLSDCTQTMMNLLSQTLSFRIALLGLLLAVSGCGDPPAGTPSPAETPETVVDRSAPQASVPKTGPTYVGVIVASETVNLSSELRGRLERVTVRPGERVRQGMILAEIQPLNLPEQIVSADAAVQMARSAVSQAETALRLARERVSRTEAAPDMFSAEQRSVALANRDTSEKDLDSAKARLVQADVELKRLRGQSARRVLRAPTDGWVAARLLDPGALVEAGEPVVRLKRSDHYLLRFAVPPAEAARWSTGTPILWRAVDPADSQEVSHPALVARVAQQVDPASQMVFVEADLDASSASGLIRDGLVVRVEPRIAS